MCLNEDKSKNIQPWALLILCQHSQSDSASVNKNWVKAFFVQKGERDLYDNNSGLSLNYLPTIGEIWWDGITKYFYFTVMALHCLHSIGSFRTSTVPFFL